MAWDDKEARDRVTRVEALLEEVEGLADPVAREKATEVVAGLVDLYGEGLARVVDAVAERDDDGRLAEALTGDELVCHLLLLHGLHPVAVEDRVLGALEEVRPYLESHGGNVELLGVEEGVAKLRLEGSCSGCPSSTMTLKLAIEKAIHAAAPDIVSVEADGATGAVSPAAAGLLQLEVVQPAASVPAATEPAWATAGGMPGLVEGGSLLKDVAGETLLFVELGGSYFAYRPDCPGCEESLGGARLSGEELTCAGCGNRYDVRRAGRCADVPDLHLEPVPLLVDDTGLVKVALGAAA